MRRDTSLHQRPRSFRAFDSAFSGYTHVNMDGRGRPIEPDDTHPVSWQLTYAKKAKVRYMYPSVYRPDKKLNVVEAHSMFGITKDDYHNLPSPGPFII